MWSVGLRVLIGLTKLLRQGGEEQPSNRQGGERKTSSNRQSNKVKTQEWFQCVIAKKRASVASVATYLEVRFPSYCS